MSETAQSFVGGEFVPSTDCRTLEMINPATEDVIGTVELAAPELVTEAVQIAAAAQRCWAAESPAQRGAKLWQLGDLVAKHVEELATLDTLNIGKPLHDSVVATRGSVGLCRYWAGMADKIWGDQLPVTPGHLNYTQRVPLGVVATILPWNAPGQGVIGRIAPALACGNAIIVKPSEYSPLSALRIAELTVEAGIPAGLVNVITGDGAVGEALTAHPGIAGLTFVGSVANGRRVNVAAAATMKKVTLEMGGKAPNLVFADADIDEAVRGTAYGVFSNSGQACIAGTRLLVQRSIADEFVGRLVDLTKQIRIGDPMSDVHLGPIATRAQYEKVLSYFTIASEEGATVATGGGRPEGVGERGFYVAPTIYTDVDNSSRICQEEIFGPVLSVVTFADDAEALELANDVEFGLSATVWTSDNGRMLRMAHELEAGVVWGNSARVMGPSLPFGGMKNSGLGNAFGDGAVEGNTLVKRVSIRYDPAALAPSFTI